LVGIPPEALRYKGFNTDKSAVSFVVSQNIKRRHLTPTQRAVLALELLPKLEKEAEERRGARGHVNQQNFAGLDPDKQAKPLGQARDIAAELAGVNKQYVSDAKRVAAKDHSGTIIEGMKAGEITMQEALKATDFKRPKPTIERDEPQKLMIVHDTEKLISRWEDLIAKIQVGDEEKRESTVQFLEHATKALDELLETLKEML
jgi:hypothetical protein